MGFKKQRVSPVLGSSQGCNSVKILRQRLGACVCDYVARNSAGNVNLLRESQVID